MSMVCFIPIKSNSERVPGKNFRVLNGKKLYEYIIEHALAAGVFDDIFNDTNSDKIKKFAENCGCKVIEHREEIARNTANGNDLLNYHFESFPNYDYYFQIFATAPYLQPSSIKACVDALTGSSVYDSCFTAVKREGFFWLNNTSINYRPCILPRSQDMLPMVEETTGLYGIARQVLEKFRCRIGTKPYIHFVSKFEAVDTTTEEDLKIAEQVGREYWKYNSDLNNKAEVSNINMKKFIGEGYKPLRAYTVIIANGTSNKGGAAA